MKYEALTASQIQRLRDVEPTVEGLARLVRASKTTVSYVLTGGPVTHGVRERFLQAIAAYPDNTVEGSSNAKRS